MNISEHLRETRLLFLDTAPLIYFVEDNEQFRKPLEYIFEQIDTGTVQAVTSPVTLAECLVIPYRTRRAELGQHFIDLITNGRNVHFYDIDQSMGQKSAELRATYGLTLTDAFQVAVAYNSGCDTFLTNDHTLKRVTEVKVLVLDDVTTENV